MRNPLIRMRIRNLQFTYYAPLSNTFGMVRANKTHPHQGWDLDATPGTAVYAIADGEVKIRTSASYGKTVLLKFIHKGKAYYAFYAHLLIQAMNNACVEEGTLLGFTGMTGNAHNIPPRSAY